MADGDTYQVMWNGTPIGAPYVVDVTNDTAGDIIEIELDWDVIRGEGASPAMPVSYRLTHADHKNPQEPQTPTMVKIDFLVFRLPEALPQHVNPNGVLTCNSLRWNAAGTLFGMEFLIPPSSFLKAGDTVVVGWKAFTDFDSPVEVPTAAKTHTFTNITEQQATNGIVWLIEPYATHLLPIWSKPVPSGMCEVTYTITGKPVSPTPTETEIALSQGEGSCNLPPKPNP